MDIEGGASPSPDNSSGDSPASGATVPMLSPDGQVGDVPQENVNEAVNKGGFKVAQDMLSPDGQQGVIPLDQVHNAIAKGFTLKGAAPKKPSQPAMQQEPESLWDKVLAALGAKGSKAVDAAKQQAGQVASSVGKGVSQLANDTYDVSAPGVAEEIWKHLHGQPNNLDKIPGKAVMAFLTAGGMPELGEIGEAGDAGEAADILGPAGKKAVKAVKAVGQGAKAGVKSVVNDIPVVRGFKEGLAGPAAKGAESAAGKVPPPNVVRGEVHNAIAEAAAKEEPVAPEAGSPTPATVSKEASHDDELSGDDPKKQVIRMMGEDGQIYDVPASESAALEEYKAGRPYKVHDKGQVIEHNHPTGGMSPEEWQAKVQESLDRQPKAKIDVHGRGPRKGQPKTYRVFDPDTKAWVTHYKLKGAAQ